MGEVKKGVIPRNTPLLKKYALYELLKGAELYEF